MKLWHKILLVFVVLFMVVPKSGEEKDVAQPSAPAAATPAVTAKPDPAPAPAAGTSALVADKPAAAQPETINKRRPELEKELAAVATEFTVAGTKVGAHEVDPVVTQKLTDTMMKVDSSNATTRQAYLGKMLLVARAVVNASMKMEGIEEVHVIVESDGAFGTPKNSLAINLLYRKSKSTPAKWGNLSSPEEMQSEALEFDIDPSLLK